MIDLLIDNKNGKLSHSEADEKITDSFATVEESQMGKSVVTRKWSDQDLAAQCFFFLMAGLETVRSHTKSFSSYIFLTLTFL